MTREEVAPLTGSVDRNTNGSMYYGEWIMVAPLTGSVDRNLLGGRDDDRRGPVAPLTGSVDRNNPPAQGAGGRAGRSPHGERG